MRTLRRWFMLGGWCGLCLPAFCGASSASAAEWMMQVEVRGRTVEGRPLHLSQEQTQLLLRDGRLFEFASAEARNARQSAPRFRPYTAGEMRGLLAEEFGPGFDVSGTGHYLVVHPRGGRDLWAERFEALYRSFRHYFQVRGFPLDSPQFPLVAVVFEDQSQFLRYAGMEGAQITPDTLGFYSPQSNRVALYDTSRLSGDWTLNADTIIHEVTHQTAFNTGVHNRFGQTPRWLAEGLATMFEPRGVWNSAQYPGQRERINHPRMRQFRQYASDGHRPGDLVEMIANDRFFEADSGRGYALAWALSFYLVETQPRRYSEYLLRTAARNAAPYPPAARLKDFTDVFGTNLPLLEAQFLRYMDGLR